MALLTASGVYLCYRLARPCAPALVWAGALALIAIPFAQRPVTTVLSGAKGPTLVRVLVATGRIQLVFGVMFAVGLALSG